MSQLINKEQWLAEVQPKFYTNLEFLKHVREVAGFMTANILHIPQAGGSLTSTLNRSSFPNPITETSDSEILAVAEDISTSQRRVAKVDVWNQNYDIRSFYTEQDINDLAERTAKYFLDKFFTGAPVIVTSGAISTEFCVAGATAGRHAISYNDMIKAKNYFDTQKVPSQGRKALLDSNLLNQLLMDDKISNLFYNDAQFSTKEGIELKASGVLGRLAGFDVLSRTDVATFSGTSGLYMPYGSTVGVSDHFGGLFWHKDLLGKNTTEVKMFTHSDSPAYLADLYAFQVQVIGTKMREDGKGVLAIRQG